MKITTNRIRKKVLTLGNDENNFLLMKNCFSLKNPIVRTYGFISSPILTFSWVITSPSLVDTLACLVNSSLHVY